MPDLDFHVTDVNAATRGLTPLLNFQLEIGNQPAHEQIHSVSLQAQIQFQAPSRAYNSREKEKLVELFGEPSQWGHTLRSRLWTNSNTVVTSFTGNTLTQLPIQCSYDLNIASAKYCYALEQGDVPLLFLFSGTVFYAAPDGRLQAQQISWDKECTYRLPIEKWRALMEQHFPNSAWLYLNRDVFDLLYRHKRAHGLATWEQTIEHLLSFVPQPKEALA